MREELRRYDQGTASRRLHRGGMRAISSDKSDGYGRADPPYSERVHTRLGK